MSAITHAEPNAFVHSALLYRSEQEYVDELARFILDGLAIGEPVLVGVPASKLAMLSGALGSDALDLTMVDMAEVGRNPARAMGLMSTFAAKYPDRRVRIVGEPVWPGRTDDEYPACVENEALANTLFAGRPVTALCPYDAIQLSETVLADARMTHPFVWQDGSAYCSTEYAPDDALARYNQPLPVKSMAVTCTVSELTDLNSVRSFAALYGRSLGLSPDGIADLQLIATELATNSLLHADGSCRLAFWLRAGHIVCEASDSGRLDDPLAGRRPPSGPTGRGLFLVNAIADLVRRHLTSGGTTIQAHLRLDRTRETTS